jgi:hypothetical protein
MLAQTCEKWSKKYPQKHEIITFFVFLETFCVGYHKRFQDFKKSAKVHFWTTFFNRSVPKLPRPTLGVLFGTLEMDPIGVS